MWVTFPKQMALEFFNNWSHINKLMISFGQGGVCTYDVKVQLYWEGRKNFAHLPLFIWHHLVALNLKWKIGHIFVAFSGYLNFNEFKNPQAQLKKKKQT